MGQGCGAVGRAIASDTRDPWFKPQYWLKIISNILICQLQFRKYENKAKGAWICPIKKCLLSNLIGKPFLSKKLDFDHPEVSGEAPFVGQKKKVCGKK